MVAAAMLTISVGSVQAADVYFGCFKVTTNKVRPGSILVNQTPACKANETLRSWDAQGPQGQQGPAGITSCHPEEFPGVIPANTFGVINMFCATGHATGAGCIWSTPFDGANNGKIYAFPRGDNFWTAVPYNDMGFQSDIKCYMQCCG
jgi:hypothetical protein